MFKRKLYSYIILFVALASMCSCAEKAEPAKPNILFVFADQFRSMEMGCYGGEAVKTPNFDRLASEGVRFSNAISTSPVCSPYRAMLLTGNFPVKNGMVTNDHFMKNPTPYFAEVCKEAGYKTGYIGKWHIDGYGRTGRIPKERWHGFDYWRTLECTHNYNHSIYFHQDEMESRTWDGYDAVAQTDDACNYITEMANNPDPFCLFLAWGPPHNPYYAPKEYMDRFDENEIVLRKNVDDFAAAERMYDECDTYFGPEFNMNVARLSSMLDKDNVDLRKWYKGYYASIAALDDMMGKIYETLDKNGQLDNTIIVFTSDHGDNLGSHRQHEKELPYEESISIPFIVRYPAKIKKGIETDALLAPIDVMPTILSLANVTCPQVDGLDISGAAQGKDENLQDAVLLMKTVWIGSIYATSGVGPWRGVRTKRYTYARKSHTKEPWMLYDNEKDPYQYNNLALNDAYAELVDELDERTSELLLEAGDPEDPEFFITRIQDEREEHGFPRERSGLVPTFVEPGSKFKEYIKSK